MPGQAAAKNLIVRLPWSDERRICSILEAPKKASYCNAVSFLIVDSCIKKTALHHQITKYHTPPVCLVLLTHRCSHRIHP